MEVHLFGAIITGPSVAQEELAEVPLLNLLDASIIHLGIMPLLQDSKVPKEG